MHLLHSLLTAAIRVKGELRLQQKVGEAARRPPRFVDFSMDPQLETAWTNKSAMHIRSALHLCTVRYRDAFPYLPSVILPRPQ